MDVDGLRILVVAPRGRGGVASAVDAVVPCLPGAIRVGVSPLGAAAWAVVRAQAGVVWLHPSLRGRALARDTLLAALALARGRRVVVQLHGWDPALAASVGPRLASLAADRVAAWGILTGPQAAALVGWGVPPHRVHRVTNAYRPGVVPARLVPTDPPTVLFVGRLQAAKGPAILLEAARQLPGVRVRFVGDGPARPALVHAAVRYKLDPRVDLPGWLEPEALRQAYAGASAVVLPSAAESFPLAVVEALAAGIPVVATDVGEVADLVGDAGRIVAPEPDAVAAAVRGVLACPPPTAAARARIRATCAPEVVAAGWRDILAQVA